MGEYHTELTKNTKGILKERILTPRRKEYGKGRKGSPVEGAVVPFIIPPSSQE